MNKDDISREWLAYAERDLLSAEHLTTLHPEPLEIICFHCQQAAEKSLKAYLSFIEIRPPKTHDLDELLSLSGENKNIQGLRDYAILLNDYSVIARYPGGGRDIDSHDRDKALQAAKMILEVVHTELKI